MGCSNSNSNKTINENLNKKKKKNESNNLINLKLKSDNGNYFINCKENVIFKNIVKKIIKEKPEFKEYGNIFLCNGYQINVNKSLKENKIKDKNIILFKKKEEIEIRKIRYIAQEIKKVSNLDVIISAKNANNLLIFDLFSKDLIIKYAIISNEDTTFIRIINKVYELNPKLNYKNNYFVNYTNNSLINEYKTLKENNIKLGNLVVINQRKENKKIKQMLINIKNEEKEIKNLAERIKRDTNIDVVITAKKIIDLLIIKFQLGELKINWCYAICNGDDIFNNVVNKIFEKKPQFKEIDSIFLCNENKINEYKSLYENNIKDGDEIIFCEVIDEIKD